MPINDWDGSLKYLKFQDKNRKLRFPFVVYADFECLTESIDTCRPEDSKSFTKKYQKHTPSGFGYLIKCFDNLIYKPKLVNYTTKATNDDVAKIFVGIE